MRIEISGTVQHVVDITQGRNVVPHLIISGQDGKPLAVRCWERSLDSVIRGLASGQTVTVTGELTSKEWQGKYFTGFEASEVRAEAAGEAAPF